MSKPHMLGAQNENLRKMLGLAEETSGATTA